jgi:hypothetical protein
MTVENENDELIVHRRNVEKHVPGLGDCQIQEPRANLELELAGSYFNRPLRVDYRRFVSEVAARLVATPSLEAPQVDALSERGRASLRVGIAQAAGVYRDYRRLSGSMLSGDERLFAAMLHRQLEAERQLAHRLRTLRSKLAAAPMTSGPSEPQALHDLRKSQESLQRLFSSPLLEGLAKMNRAQESMAQLSKSPALGDLNAWRKNRESMQKLTHFSQPSGLNAMPSNQESMERLLRSPALEAIGEAQKKLAGIGRSPFFEAMRKNQERLLRSPALEAIGEAQKKLAGIGRSPFFEAMRKNQERLLRSPALEAIGEAQKKLAEFGQSPLFETIGEQSRKLGALAGEGFTRGFEAFTRFVDEHWADLQGYPPDHPPPVMFVVASLPMSIGLPIYQAVKSRREESLLKLIEPVVTNPSFVEDVQAAIHQAPLLSPIARRHLVTAFDWLKQKQYVDAYPPLYNGLEPAFTAVARSAGIIDDDNRFLISGARKTKASKVEDLFEHLPLGSRYRRYLLSWIFGEAGHPFRHGDVSDPAECRRQSLRLAVAVIGWLETFGEWEKPTFWTLLEAEASKPAA